ncbi:tetratricopeptide repeat protein [Alloacidobacterium dinghuense]|uniref:Tetratricopeptide repeat protein n=1 Tax=Alloacidobacterium dinghuense TaxID=2763107 RepID=A0A7G8BP11_9BACT|nr:tetratricopeptide repeat protein [Alloacidobacterium dinghuense]QNI34281.1 tetratricopeptide repeat protein [Alloacidobacterium dinghuense]
MKSLKYLATIVFTSALLSAHAQSVPMPPGTSTNEPSPEAAAKSADDPLAQAEAAIDTKDFAHARSLLDTYLSGHSNDARALFDRGYVEDAQEHDHAAANYYQKAIAADPNQFESHLAVGLILARQDKQQDAHQQLEAASRLEPNPPNPAAKAQAFRALAELDRSANPDAAKQELIQALSISPETPADLLLTGEIAEAEGDEVNAETAYRRALNQQPESSAATAGLAHVLIAQKKYADAEPLIKSALIRDPDDPALNSQLAIVLNAEGKQNESVAALEKLHAKQPDDASISGMLADAYTQAGAADKADPLYVQLLKSNPNDPALLTARGENLIRQQRYAEAVVVLQKTVSLRPDSGNAWSSLAFAASENHQPQLVIDSLSARSKYLEETPATYFLWATAYDNLHHTREAADYYHKFLTASNGRFPDQEWQAKHRLVTLGK